MLEADYLRLKIAQPDSLTPPKPAQTAMAMRIQA